MHMHNEDKSYITTLCMKKKDLKQVNNIPHHHHPFSLFQTKIFIHVQYLQGYNHDQSQ